MNTKAIIENAAFSLFKEFPFDTITVQMILNKAEVSRKTFYKYYADKYELMEIYYRNFMDNNIREHYNGHNWNEVLINLFDFVNIDNSYFKNVLNTEGQDSFWSFIHDYSYQFYSSVKFHNEKRSELTEEEHLTIIMIVDGEISAFKHLIEEKVSISNASLSSLLCSLIPQSYKELLHDESSYSFSSF